MWLARFFSYLARGRRSNEMVRPFAVAADGAGRIVVADPDARCVHIFDTQNVRYERLTDAGGQPFASPVGVASGPDGRLYISDSRLGLVFRYAGKGEWDEPLGTGSELQRPTGLAFHERLGLLYVVDTGAHRILVFNSEGERVREIGRRGTGDGEFNYPVAVAVGPRGRLYVTDAMNFRVQILGAAGEHIRSFGQGGTSPGDLDKAKGIAVDEDGHIYLAEALHDVVHVYDQTGQLLTVIGGTGKGAGQFWLPSGIHIDHEGRILIADSANGRVQILRYLGDPENGEGQ
jgi:DNA-binding beta-propeller fold protein YncE